MREELGWLSFGGGGGGRGGNGIGKEELEDGGRR